MSPPKVHPILFFLICTFDGGYSVFRLGKLYKGKCVSVTTLCDHKTIF